MTTDRLIAIAGLVIAVVAIAVSALVTIIANRSRDDALAIVSAVVPTFVNWTINSLSIIGALLFWQSQHVASLFCWVVGATIYSFFFLRSEDPPTRTGVFMLVFHFSAVISFATLILISRMIDMLDSLMNAPPIH